MFSTLFLGTFSHRYTVASVLRNWAAHARAIPWLPVDAVTTPFFLCASVIDFRLFVTPRSLKAPQRYIYSCLINTFAPYFFDRAFDFSRGVSNTRGLILLLASLIFCAETPVTLLIFFAVLAAFFGFDCAVYDFINLIIKSNQNNSMELKSNTGSD